MHALAKNNLQETDVIGNPKPQPQLKPPQPIACIGQQGPPWNKNCGVRGRLGKYPNLEG